MLIGCKNNAQQAISFESVDKAFNCLKEAIASGHLVEVHLSCYYVYDDFALASGYWRDIVKKGQGTNPWPY